MIRVELFGVARLKAGASELSVEAASLGEALCAVERRCPGLELVRAGALAPSYLCALNGKSFTGDASLALADGDVLVIVSAQAGG